MKIKKRIAMYKLTFIGVCFIILPALCFSQEIKKPVDGSNPMLILRKEGVQYAYPHFSKNADKILFQSNETGYWRICTMNTDGSDIIALSPDSVNYYFPDWSPDNHKICFVSDKTGNEEIYIMNSDGSNQQQLTNNRTRNIHPYFSPDGKRVLFSSTLNSSEDLEVYQMNADGTEISRITISSDNETCARMSPDNAYITYLKNNDKGLDDLFLLSIADSSETNLTNTRTMDGWPTWSHNGEEIIFSTVENDMFKLFSYNLENRSLTRLTNSAPGHNDCRANISTDGKMIVFNRQHDNETGRTNAIYILFL
jgi:Tol biopolymer transport system component